MLMPKTRVLTIACGLTVALLFLPTHGMAQCCGVPAAPVAVTAYSPVVTYSPVVAAPPQTYAYMPSVVYRAVYRPAVVSAYAPVAANASYAVGYSSVTTYRPFLGTYQTRLVPYTTYRPVYTAMPVVAYSGCSSCVSYDAAPSCAPCGSCGVATYAPSGCSSCSAATTTSMPGAQQPQAAPPKTFDAEKPAVDQKPAADPNIQPKPDPQMNPTSLPSLSDPRDRTASRVTETASRTRLVASPAASVKEYEGWQPARD
jgi:hypothetical protein